MVVEHDDGASWAASASASHREVFHPLPERWVVVVEACQHIAFGVGGVMHYSSYGTCVVVDIDDVHDDAFRRRDWADSSHLALAASLADVVVGEACQRGECVAKNYCCLQLPRLELPLPLAVLLLHHRPATLPCCLLPWPRLQLPKMM